ncbi:FAD-dependent oxidoreductase [Salsuginibacillus kocurii]|uniref:FAD-dependent oxidoreductase n=1 Tax=Salsuginibacillus kocurii TaxID=427078 RepID=UPI000379BAE6|nr:FAD-dependent oxidoreductase [Salsuginibacillus kocurii]
MHFVIIGGDAAGMSAAMQIIRKLENAEVTVLERGGYFSYAQCGLPYVISNEVESTRQLVARDVNTFREKYGIDARTFHHVSAVDPEEKTVSGFAGETGSEPFTISYDRLLIATGARPSLPDWEGKDLHGVHTLKTIPDIEKIKADLAQTKDITVIGTGYVGIELAETMRTEGYHVRLIQRGDHLAPMLDPDMAEHIQKEAETHGYEIHTNEDIERLEGNSEGRVQKVHTKHSTFETDMVIVATGVHPNVEFLAGTGITLGKRGAISVNRYMQTSLPDVYAAGDCAVQYHRIKETDEFLPLGTHANKQGRIAGLNLIGQPRTFKGVVGTALFRFHGLTTGLTGLTEKEAQDLNLPYATAMHTASHNAGYFKNHLPLHIKLVYQTDTKRILGGQIIGEAGADKRLDVLATALFHNMTLDEFEDLDLSYSPPYNGVWDPLQQTIRRRQ